MRRKDTRVARTMAGTTTGRRRARIAAGLALAGIWASLGLASVSATTTVDERQVSPPTGWQPYIPHAIPTAGAIRGAALAQSFVPRVDGRLTGIELFAYAAADWKEPVVVE